MNELVYKSYVDAYMKNIDMMIEKNKEVHKVKKKRFFLKLKKFFFENRLLKSVKHENLIESMRLASYPVVPLTFSDDYFDNIYESYLKKDIKTKEDMDQLLEGEPSITLKKFAGPVRRRQERRLILLNGYNPFTESQYWEEYMKMSNIRHTHGKRMEDTWNRNKEINSQITAEKLKIENFLENNKKIVLDGIVNKEISGMVEPSDDKNIKDMISQ